jgi:PAS domain S-box-containing protein
MADLLNEVLQFLKTNDVATNLYSIAMIAVVIGLTVKFLIIPSYKHVWIPIVNFFKRLSSAIEKVSLLEKEFRSNGGSTLKDVVSRIEQQLIIIHAYMDKTRAKQEALFQFLGMGQDGFAFFESDKNGECIYASPKFCEITGLIEDEALGMGWISAIHNDDRDRVYNEWKTCVNQHRAFVLNYRQHNRRINKTTPVLCYSIPLRSSEGITSYLGTIRECRE